MDKEILFVGTAEAEHVEMYLKAIWHIQEKNMPAKVNEIAKMLNIRGPSVVQMLKTPRKQSCNLQQGRGTTDKRGNKDRYQHDAKQQVT